MKKFFEKASKPFNLPSLSRTNTAESSSASVPTSNHILPGHLPLATPGLGPKYVVPAVPHPRPYTHLALLATKDGLLIRPHGAGETLLGYIKLSWGKNITIEEMESRSEDQLDWKDSVVVYGIVGILELFSCPFTSSILSWGLAEIPRLTF